MMKSTSIKTKVILVIALSLIAGALALIFFVQKSYEQNVDLVARQSLDSARKSYRNMEQNDYRGLVVASTGFLQDAHMRDLYAKRDRAGLIKYLKPITDDLKANYDVSLFSFVDPDKKMFLRMLQPKKFGDAIKMQVLENAIKTKGIATGSELGKAGYALRCTRPCFDNSGKLIGYFLIGDTYDSFLSTMKSQTGDEYTMVGLKSLCDEKKYHAGQIQKNLKDTWNDFKNVVVLSATTDDHGTANYDAELQSVPADGRLLGAVTKGGKTIIRGVFPLIDLANKNIGGVFVEHDITPLYTGMQSVRTSAIIAIVILMVFISIVIAALLNSLVFTRLSKTMDVATRMVGGDYETQIVPGSDDEVGRLELLLEQFRNVFVNTIKDMESDSKP